MEETKAKEGRLFWLKLEQTFFGQKEIKALRRIEGGDTYTLIYLKMMLASLADNGKLFYDGFGNTFADEMSLALDEDLDVVEATINFLSQYGLLAKTSETEYQLTAVLGMTGSKSEAAVRKAKSRENQRQAMCDNVTSESQPCHDTSQNVTQRREELEYREDLDSRSDLRENIREDPNKEPIEKEDSSSGYEPIKENSQNENINDCDIVNLVKDITGYDDDNFIYGHIKSLLDSGYELEKLYGLIKQNRKDIEDRINAPCTECFGEKRAVDFVFDIFDNSFCTSTSNESLENTRTSNKYTEQDVVNYIISLTGYNDQEYISKQLSERFWINHYNVDEVYDCIKENEGIIQLIIRDVDCNIPTVINKVIDTVEEYFNGNSDIPF